MNDIFQLCLSRPFQARSCCFSFICMYYNLAPLFLWYFKEIWLTITLSISRGQDMANLWIIYLLGLRELEYPSFSIQNAFLPKWNRVHIYHPRQAQGMANLWIIHLLVMEYPCFSLQNAHEIEFILTIREKNHRNSFNSIVVVTPFSP